MSRFRPCIDLHDGRVKQIVGGSLKDDGSTPATNFVSDHPAEFYAELYRNDHLTGGHVIMLGKGNEAPARAALAAWVAKMAAFAKAKPNIDVDGESVPAIDQSKVAKSIDGGADRRIEHKK